MWTAKRFIAYVFVLIGLSILQWNHIPPLANKHADNVHFALVFLAINIILLSKQPKLESSKSMSFWGKLWNEYWVILMLPFLYWALDLLIVEIGAYIILGAFFTYLTKRYWQRFKQSPWNILFYNYVLILMVIDKGFLLQWITVSKAHLI